MRTLKLIIGVFLALCTGLVQAQNSQKMNDSERLSIGVWIPEQIEGLTASAHNMLENKLSQVIAANGIGDMPNSRFIMSANVIVLTKDITPTAPPMQAYTLEITFYIGDGYEGKAFSSYSTTLKGVGENETKAYISAMKNIKTNDPNYQKFIDKAKSKILAYYETNCDFIIKSAITLAKTNQFDEAIWELTSIPTVCTSCWNRVMDAVGPIFQVKIDLECRAKLNEANNVWNAGQSWDAAQEAGSILSTIDPNASCYKDIKPLAEKISKRIYDIDQREWNFTVDSEIGLKRDMIKAYRDVGVAYGNGQTKNVTYKSLW